MSTGGRYKSLRMEYALTFPVYAGALRKIQRAVGICVQHEIREYLNKSKLLLSMKVGCAIFEGGTNR